MSCRVVLLVWNLALVFVAYADTTFAQRFTKHESLSGHRNMVTSVAFSPNGQAVGFWKRRHHAENVARSDGSRTPLDSGSFGSMFSQRG